MIMQGTKSQDLKICSRCKVEKTLDDYGMRLGKKQAACRECINNAQKINYQGNKKYWLDMNRRNRANNRDRYNEEKSKHSCGKCGVSFLDLVNKIFRVPNAVKLAVAHGKVSIAGNPQRSRQRIGKRGAGVPCGDGFGVSIFKAAR